MSINIRGEEGFPRLVEPPKVTTPVQEVVVGDLLGDSFSTEYSESTSISSGSNFYMNVPNNLHSNLSITDSLYTMNTNRMEDLLENDSRHQYHNPMIKALSNSNLTMFEQNASVDSHSISQPFEHTPKYTHSAVNLLDSVNEEVTLHASLIAPPPRRPPPPHATNSSANLFQSNGDQFTKPTTQNDSIPKSNSFGFEDDFSLIPVNRLASKSEPPTRPPPLPPFPGVNSNSNQPTRTKYFYFYFRFQIDLFTKKEIFLFI